MHLTRADVATDYEVAPLVDDLAKSYAPGALGVRMLAALMRLDDALEGHDEVSELMDRSPHTVTVPHNVLVMAGMALTILGDTRNEAGDQPMAIDLLEASVALTEAAYL